jgi:hypothetical protein
VLRSAEGRASGCTLEGRYAGLRCVAEPEGLDSLSFPETVYIGEKLEGSIDGQVWGLEESI